MVNPGVPRCSGETARNPPWEFWQNFKSLKRGRFWPGHHGGLWGVVYFFSFQKAAGVSEQNLGIRWCWVTCVHHGWGLWGVVVLWCPLVSAEPPLSCHTGTFFLVTLVWIPNEKQNF